MIGSLSGAFSFVSANQVDPWWLSGGIPAANCIAAYQPKGAASLAASYVNLANPGTYNAAPGVAPTWDAVNGWIFDGISQYLKGPIVDQLTGSFVIRFSNITNAGYIGGWNGTAGIRFGISPNLSASGVRYRCGSYDGNVLPVALSGIFSLSDKGYRNGNADTTAFTISSSFSLLCVIGALWTGAAASNYCAEYVQAASFYSIKLSPAQEMALNTAMAAL
jgi:hypothetical protein